MLRRLFLFCLLLAVVATFAPAAAARSITIERFDAEIIVLESGAITVTETIRFHFTGSWNGIVRDIPVEYRTPQGFNYTLRLNVESITDDLGNRLEFESSRQRHYRSLKIWVPGASDATRTIVLRYKVANALRFFEEHDELYWNVTGDEWEMPIEAANATVMLPSTATGIRTLAFTGSYGSQDRDAQAETTGTTVRFTLTRPLAFREGLTIVIGWDKGAVKEPGPLERIAAFFYSNWPLFMPLIVFAVIYHLWRTRGRDPQLNPISVQYEPPANLSPGEVGTLTDNSADMRDITATIVDLAVRGYLVIKEKEESQLLGLIKNKDYIFTLEKPSEEWTGLKPHERELLKGMFSNGRKGSIELDDLQNKFYKSVPGIKNEMFRALLNRRYYTTRPDHVKRNYFVAGLLIGFFTVWGGGFLSAFLGIQPFAFIAAGVLSGLIIIAFAFVMPARTLEGARALEKVRGFEDFLGRVEADRMERMVRTPEMFEKFLPYAMALGVEKQWSKAFENIYTQSPRWYVGPGYGPRFYPSLFVSDLNTMASRASTVMASAPRSSGGSGFSGGGGGGFSGGGFGGGGGRGF